LGRGISSDQFYGVPRDKARQKKVNRNGQKERQKKFKGATAKMLHK
jgi:hypothetical protein